MYVTAHALQEKYSHECKKGQTYKRIHVYTHRCNSDDERERQQPKYHKTRVVTTETNTIGYSEYVILNEHIRIAVYMNKNQLWVESFAIIHIDMKIHPIANAKEKNL